MSKTQRGKRFSGRGMWLVCGLILAGHERGRADEAAPAAPSTVWSFKPEASIADYTLYQSNPMFSDEERHWMETSVRAGGRVEYRGFSFEAVALGVKTTGQDPYGSGNAPADLPPGAPRVGLAPVFDLDTFYAQWDGGENLPVKISVGRQPLALGTQFLVGKGVFDGYFRDYPQGVWSTPRNWFDLARVQVDWAKTHYEAIYYRVNPSQDAAGGTDGYVTGVDVTHEFESIKGTYGGAALYRGSPSRQDNDMTILDARGKQSLPQLPSVYVGGEYVRQLGTGRNGYYVGTPGGHLDTAAWHVEMGVQADQTRFKPFAELGYLHFDPSYTPLATGYSDYDSWYFGNQIQWIMFGTDTRMIRAKAGFWPHEKVRVLAFFHHVELATGPTGPLSDEWTLVGEWRPTAKWLVSASLGYSLPGRALAAAGLESFFDRLNHGASLVGDSASFDVSVGVGFTY